MKKDLELLDILPLKEKPDIKENEIATKINDKEVASEVSSILSEEEETNHQSAKWEALTTPIVEYNINSILQSIKPVKKIKENKNITRSAKILEKDSIKTAILSNENLCNTLLKFKNEKIVIKYKDPTKRKIYNIIITLND